MFELDFGRGVEAGRYLTELSFFRSVIDKLIESADPDPDHVTQLADAIKLHVQPVRATAMTEDWCGDSACNIPILAPFFLSAGVEFAVFHGSDYSELETYYNDTGDDHIPAVSIWDGNGKEIARWIEQPKQVLDRKNAWEAENPSFMEFYRIRETDRKAAGQFAALYRELMQKMSDWYVDGMWRETTREIVEVVTLS